MEEKIRNCIEFIKRELKHYQAELERETDLYMRYWISARITGLEHEMNTLEDLLLSWEEYQKYGNCIPF
jgi:hypothetical protein